MALSKSTGYYRELASQRRQREEQESTPAASVTSFDLDRWYAMWADLDEETKLSIRAKSAFEHMSRSAVVREWWPDLWAKVVSR